MPFPSRRSAELIYCLPLFLLMGQLSACNEHSVCTSLIISSNLNLDFRRDTNDANAYMNRGMIRSECGDRIGAIQDFSEVIKLGVKLPKVNYNIAEGYFQRGQQYRILGDTRKAIEDYQKAASLYKEWKDEFRYQLIVDDINALEGHL